jgi:2-haloacid dehalogenase/putative hydrolase of the HAD superfamily
VDDDLFSVTNGLLEVDFDHIVTARQLGSYKPARANFVAAMQRFGLDKRETIHVAQSIHHDIIPSNKLGWNNIWVNRYGEPARTRPEEFPDLEVPDLASLVRIIDLELRS